MNIELGSIFQLTPFLLVIPLAMICVQMLTRRSKRISLVDKEDAATIAQEAELLFCAASKGDRGANDEIERMVSNQTWKYYGVITLSSAGIPTIQKNKHELWKSSGVMHLPLLEHEEYQ